MAREMADTALPRYKVDASGDLVPDVRAAAAIIYDPDTNQVLWEENSQSQRSIASITKVMTATVFLENNPDLTQPVTIARSDVFQASTTHLRANDKVTTDDLLHLLLIASDNAAARALARVSPHGSEGFIRRMNEKAAELGLREHALRGSVGSAVGERVVGLRHGAPHHARVAGRADLVDHAHLRIHGLQRQSARSRSTARTTCCGRGDVDVRAGKTGFISKAGYCLATLLRLPRSRSERRGRRLRRAVERRPVHGVAQSVQLGVVEGLDALRDETGDAAAITVAGLSLRAPASSTRRSSRSAPRRSRPTHRSAQRAAVFCGDLRQMRNSAMWDHSSLLSVPSVRACGGA